MNFNLIKQYVQEYDINFVEAELEKMHFQSVKSKKGIAKLIGGDSGFIPMISELDRKRLVLETIRYRAEGYRGAKEVIDRISNLSDEAIFTNRLTEPFELEGRVYQEGTKITKLFGKINSRAQFSREAEAFANDPLQITGVKLSILPEDFLKAGVIGESCYSPGGENWHKPFLMSRSNIWAVAYDEGWNARCWILIDIEKGQYFLNYSYPRSSMTMVYSVDAFLQSKGLKRIEDLYNHYSLDDYYDADQNPYPELNSVGEMAKIPDSNRGKTDGHQIAAGTTGCAMTGNPSYTMSSYVYCEGCNEMFRPDQMYNDYCGSCNDDDYYDDYDDDDDDDYDYDYDDAVDGCNCESCTEARENDE